MPDYIITTFNSPRRCVMGRARVCFVVAASDGVKFESLVFEMVFYSGGNSPLCSMTWTTRTNERTNEIFTNVIYNNIIRIRVFKTF